MNGTTAGDLAVAVEGVANGEPVEAGAVIDPAPEATEGPKPKAKAKGKPKAAKPEAEPKAKGAKPKAEGDKGEAAPKAKADGLRGPQVRILKALAAADGPLSRKQIAEQAPCDGAWLGTWVGSEDAELRARKDKEVMPSLVGLGFVRHVAGEADGKPVTLHAITPAGKKALAKLTG